MRGVLLAAALVLGWLTLEWFYHRRGLSKLPEISDDEFLLRFSKRFSAERDRILQARRQVGRRLLVPERKLAPEYHFEELARRLNRFGHFGMGWEDLEERADDAARQAGAPRPARAAGSCPTIGDLVAGLIQAQVVEPPAEPTR